jgi:hypothetical protein
MTTELLSELDGVVTTVVVEEKELLDGVGELLKLETESELAVDRGTLWRLKRAMASSSASAETAEVYSRPKRRTLSFCIVIEIRVRFCIRRSMREERSLC